jgi:hypothetical protein
MTPKEKAQEIWMKIFQKQIEITGSADGNLCVEMALIAVDLLMEEAYRQHDYEGFISYWKEVKQEIEKL